METRISLVWPTVHILGPLGSSRLEVEHLVVVGGCDDDKQPRSRVVAMAVAIVLYY